MKAWLKWGLIGAGIFLIFEVLGILASIARDEGATIFFIIPLLFMKYTGRSISLISLHLFNIIFLLIIGFLFGAFIGFIIGKIRSKK